MKFFSRYNRVPQHLSVMDFHDDVNRLSYVDSTAMVKRMIFEGQNLMAYRAVALQNGMYTIEDMERDEDVPAIPVYETDPALGKIYHDAYKEKLDELMSTRGEASASVPEGSMLSGTEEKLDAASGE